MHFRLTKEVPKAMQVVAPIVIKAVSETWNSISVGDDPNITFALHTGGPKVLQHFMENVPVEGLNAEEAKTKSRGHQDHRVRDSLETLMGHGNIASVSLFSTIRSRMTSSQSGRPSKCVLAGCGPGMAAEWLCASLHQQGVVQYEQERLGIKDRISGQFDVVFDGVDAAKLADIERVCNKGKRVAILASGPVAVSKMSAALQEAVENGQLLLFEGFQYVSHARLLRLPGYLPQDLPMTSILARWKGSAGGLYEFWARRFVDSNDSDVGSGSEEEALMNRVASLSKENKKEIIANTCMVTLPGIVQANAATESRMIESTDKASSATSDLLTYSAIAIAMFAAGWVAAKRSR